MCARCEPPHAPARTLMTTTLRQPLPHPLTARPAPTPSHPFPGVHPDDYDPESTLIFSWGTNTSFPSQQAALEALLRVLSKVGLLVEAVLVVLVVLAVGVVCVCVVVVCGVVWCGVWCGVWCVVCGVWYVVWCGVVCVVLWCVLWCGVWCGGVWMAGRRP